MGKRHVDYFSCVSKEKTTYHFLRINGHKIDELFGSEIKRGFSRALMYDFLVDAFDFSFSCVS